MGRLTCIPLYLYFMFFSYPLPTTQLIITVYSIIDPVDIHLIITV